MNAGTKFSVRMSLKGGRLNGWSDHERRRGLSESIAALVMVGLDLEGATASAAAVVICTGERHGLVESPTYFLVFRPTAKG